MVEGLNIKVDIDKDQVQRMVAQSIIDSAIDDEVKKAIDGALKKKSYDRGSVVESAVQTAVYDSIRSITVQIVRDECGDKIREAVRRHLNDEKIEEIASIIVTRYTGDLYGS